MEEVDQALDYLHLSVLQEDLVGEELQTEPMLEEEVEMLDGDLEAEAVVQEQLHLGLTLQEDLEEMGGALAATAGSSAAAGGGGHGRKLGLVPEFGQEHGTEGRPEKGRVAH